MDQLLARYHIEQERLALVTSEFEDPSEDIGARHGRSRSLWKTAGAWLQIASPFTAEIMSRAGFDWLIIDLEHGPGDILTLVAQLQAMNGTSVRCTYKVCSRPTS